MMAGLFSARNGWRLGGAAVVLLTAVLLSGCEPVDPYPADLTYPARSDVIVVEAPKLEDVPADRPGQFTAIFAGLKTLDRLESEGKLNANTLPPELQDLPNLRLYKTIDPELLPAGAREALQKTLEKHFGRPSAPKVDLDDKAALEQLKLDDKTLAEGSKLYRRHCLHCHGLTGDGRGPTAPWVNPHPRDYRPGIYKFISVTEGRPTREDLSRTLHEGIEGTSMPSFKLLPEEHITAIISYVIHLSLRGQIEMEVLKYIDSNKTDVKAGDVVDYVGQIAPVFLKGWSDARANEIPVLEYPKEFNDKKVFEESVRNGHKIFINEGGVEGACIGCHKDYGRQNQFRYDVWGTMVRPANLTTGIYRGGRRPIDLYYRVHGGIPPSGMPKAPDTVAKNPKYIWDLVNFVQALPYPSMLPPDVRDRIYGDKK